MENNRKFIFIFYFFITTMDNKILAEAFKNTLIDLLQNDDNIQNIICNIVSKQKNYENLINNYKNKIDELTAEIDKLKSENSQIIKLQIENLKLTKLESDNSQFIDELNKKNNDLNNQIKALKSTNQQLNNELEKLQNSNYEKDIMFAEANNNIENLKYELKEFDNLKKDYDKLKKNNQNLVENQMDDNFIDLKIILNNISKNSPFIIQQWLKFDTTNDDFIVDSNVIFRYILFSSRWKQIELLWDILRDNCEQIKQEISTNELKLLEKTILLFNLSENNANATAKLLFSLQDNSNNKFDSKKQLRAKFSTTKNTNVKQEILPGLIDSFGDIKKQAIIITD